MTELCRPPPVLAPPLQNSTSSHGSPPVRQPLMLHPAFLRPPPRRGLGPEPDSPGRQGPARHATRHATETPRKRVGTPAPGSEGVFIVSGALEGLWKLHTGPSERGECLGAASYSPARTGDPQSAAATTLQTLSPPTDGKLPSAKCWRA